jgi:hypothetical protein
MRHLEVRLPTGAQQCLNNPSTFATDVDSELNEEVVGMLQRCESNLNHWDRELRSV